MNLTTLSTSFSAACCAALRVSFSSVPILVGSLVAKEALAEAPYSFLKTPGKLPKDVLPMHYAVHLKPDLQPNLAHQWFGNLVTNAWWDNLWLNEGFASWMQAKATAKLHPEWDSTLDDLLNHDHTMHLDAHHSSHAIQQTILNEEQAAAAFDSITYNKASAVLGMLESYIGEDVFRRGIAEYMRRHQYSNTTSADLWAALERASGKPVGKIASVHGAGFHRRRSG